MKRLVFTADNRAKTRAGVKTQTRRIGKPRFQVGDVVALCEPTAFEGVSEAGDRALIFYPDESVKLWKEISRATLAKIEARKEPLRTAIARFMLDDFARHYCRIVEVREELLQEISPDDCMAEGIEQTHELKGYPYYRDYLNGGGDLRPIESFKSLWDSINTAPDRRWDANPIVTAYTYEFMGSE